MGWREHIEDHTTRTDSRSSPMQQDIPYGLYREELTSLGHGLALWNPNPPKHSHGNVSISDVGFIREGTFFRMLNAILPWDHKSNGKPGPFKSLDCGPFANITENPLVEEHHSRRVETTNASNSCSVNSVSL